ncbi:MAG TPA: ammonium transporter [Verrucomicrobiae bacterium]|nr:ammonium transporter [Verrucomicrobiae bacterium]
MFHSQKLSRIVVLWLGVIGALIATQSFAQQAAPTDPIATLTGSVDGLKIAGDTFWVLITGALVFFMNLGFGLVESGLQRQKNCVNILSKNFVVFAASCIAFFFIGWGLMFGDGTGLIGLKGLWMVGGTDNSPATGDAYKGVYSAINWTGVPLMAKFFFQLVFAGTAATIVSGSVGERIKFHAFIIYSLILVGIFYPITGHWIWGGGWLAKLGFYDFAGSTVVHSVGGWSALVGAIILGPRIGKFSKDGKVNPIPGHSMTSVFIGLFVLWIGWFGFNPGSTMALGDGQLISHIFNTTNLAACAGTLTSMLTAWFYLGKPDFSMMVNGCLAGLVAITAPCAWVTPGAALIIGAIGGVWVVFAVIMFDKLRVDDPVGACAVHLGNGVWGTLAVGLFATKAAPGSTLEGLFYGGGFGLLKSQLIGIAAVGVFTVIVNIIVWKLLKATVGIRVKPEEETEGLDIGEHGQNAYPDFVVTQPAGIHAGAQKT